MSVKLSSQRGSGWTAHDIAAGDMLRSVKSLLKFVSVLTSIHNHSKQGRHLNLQDDFKKNLATVFAEWRQLAA